MKKVRIEVDATNEFAFVEALQQLIAHCFLFKETLVESGMRIKLEKEKSYTIKADLPNWKDE